MEEKNGSRMWQTFKRALHLGNSGSPTSPGDEALIGAGEAAMAGKPIAAEILATDAVNHGINVDKDHLVRVAKDNAGKIAAQKAVSVSTNPVNKAS